MGAYNLIGFLLVAALGGVVVVVFLQRYPGLRAPVRNLFLLGFALRLVGSTARYEVFHRFYHGGGDAGVYYRAGLVYAEFLRRLDLAILFDSSLWWLGKWWGTQIIRFLSGFILTVIGPSMRGEFLAFTFLSFGGLVFLGVAFHKAYPWVAPEHYLRWIWLWPSLWFWPASIGKEAVILLAIGMTVAGHVGDGRRSRWPLMIGGLGLAFVIRPHVAAVLIFAAAASNWFFGWKKRTQGWTIRSMVVIVLATIIALLALQRLGIDQVDLESVQEYMSRRSDMTAIGGSAIEGGGGGLLSIPMAFVNILMRPFPWEAHHALALVSSLEMVAFWLLLWKRRRSLRAALKTWNRNRLLSFALPFAVLYILMIGLVFRNLGIIARQRVLVFPFLFLLLEIRPIPAAWIRALRAGRRRRRRQDASARSSDKPRHLPAARDTTA